MKFGDDFVDQVRNTVSITGLIGGYVNLKKSGRDYAALCPFHQEKTPSFTVSESKQIFKCFGCGAGGDVFKFIMLMENLSFPEAIRFLAERHGIPLPQPDPQARRREERRGQLAAVMEEACRLFQKWLAENAEAQRYLESRRIESRTVEEMKLGYAPPGSRLSEALRKEGRSTADLVACGLVREDDRGEMYDRFRNRIIFPIQDLSGRTIAFGGRALGDGLPKYLNSPDTGLYKKSNQLYPLNRSRDEIRRREFAILVEGYFDCIVPFQAGIRNVVASLGTSLTESQVKLLGRYTRNVVINFDPDSAGTAASLRSIDLFLDRGFRVNVLSLPGGADPDTFILEQGRSAYIDLVKKSKPYLEFVLGRMMEQQKDPGSPRGKREIVSSMLPYLARVPDRIERAEYVTRLASRLQVDEDVIVAELRKMARPRQVEIPSSLTRIDEVTPAETTLLAAVLEETWVESTLPELDAELFAELRTTSIFQQVLDLRDRQQAVTVIELGKKLDEADRDLLQSLSLRTSEIPLSEEVIRNSLLALRRKRYETLSRQIQEEIKREEKADSGSQKVEDLLLEKERLKRKSMELEEEHSQLLDF